MMSSDGPSSSSSLQHQLSIIGGSSLFTGFTRLCKGLAVILVSGYILLQFIPSAITYLALIPARTIPFAWNLVTAGYLEQSLPGVAISTVGLLFFGKLLEPLWGPREFLKFIIVVNFLTSICVFVTAIGLYYITTQESYLYTPFSGFHGVLSGFLVGIKQIIPDQELSLLKIKVKWLPTLFVLISVVIGFLITESASYIPTIIFGIYMSWIYLRYFQRKPETGLKGDPSDEFSFSSFFPEFLRPILDPIASIFDRALCGRSQTSGESGDHTLDESHLPGSDPVEALRRRSQTSGESGDHTLDESHLPGSDPVEALRRRSQTSGESGDHTLDESHLPGSDPVEALRRRERGARALEQRLAAEKLNKAGTSAEGGTQPGDAADNA